jgi:hypothetical protein
MSMNVKLTGGLVGDRFAFLPRQVIRCSDRTGARLIADGTAVEAPPGAEIEGEHFDKTAEDRLAEPTRRGAERAVLPAAETPERAATPAVCKSLTTQGNPCKRAPVPGSKFCAKHGG